MLWARFTALKMGFMQSSQIGGRVPADINDVYILNPKNLRSSLAQTWLSSTCGLYEPVAPGRAAAKNGISYIKQVQ